MMTDRFGPFDPRHADALFALAHIERGAFARRRRQIPQYRLHDFRNVECGLVAGAKPTGCARQAPCSVWPLRQIVIHSERARQAQYRGPVETGAPAQFRQRQMGVVHAERRKDAHRPAHGHHAFFCRGLVGILKYVFVHCAEHVSLYGLALY
ncbi:hypothetical protein D3C72_1560380 [compost metagenome]